MADDDADDPKLPAVSRSFTERLTDLFPALATTSAPFLPFLIERGDMLLAFTVALVGGTNIANAKSLADLEERVKDGLRRASRSAEDVKDDLDWYKAMTDTRLDQIVALIEQTQRTTNPEKVRQVLHLGEAVGAGDGSDDDRGKVISEVGRLGPSHIKLLLEIHRRWAMANRPGRGTDLLEEQFVQELSPRRFDHLGGEIAVDALVGAGFVRRATISAGRLVNPLSARTAAGKTATLDYVASTALGVHALRLLKHKV